MIYRFLYDKFLVRTDPEVAHHVAMEAIGWMGRTPVAPIVAATVGNRGGGSFAGLLSKPLPGRLGMAAGQDKNATAVLGTLALGFGFTEIGTVTPLPQPGNDKPRLWRIPGARAFRNRMGFNNEGADAVADRLCAVRGTRRGKSAIIGVNIGKNKWVSASEAPADYSTCARKLAPYADYLVINVSSPNTPGLRDLQALDSLNEIAEATLEAVAAATDRPVPVLVKIAPDLADEDIAEIAKYVAGSPLAGIVATNTTINHAYGEGGVSGAPVLDRAVEVVAQLREILGPDKIVIGVGGVFTVEDSQRLINAGADLLEVLTGFVYEGPLMPGRINRALARTAG